MRFDQTRPAALNVIADLGRRPGAASVAPRPNTLDAFQRLSKSPGDLPRPIRVAPSNLIGVASPQNLDRSLEQDREIEPEGPVVDVPEVIFDASFD